MHPDDVKAALDALVSEEPSPRRGPSETIRAATVASRSGGSRWRGWPQCSSSRSPRSAQSAGSKSGPRRVTSVPTTATTTTAPFVPRTGESSPHPSSIFPSTLEAWKCGNPLRFTDDGGVTWRSIPLPREVPAGGGPCTAVPGGNAWMLFGPGGRDGKILRVRGFTHVEVFSLPRSLLNQAHSVPTFVDKQYGWMAAERTRSGQARRLYRTVNGGKNWFEIPTNDGMVGPGTFTDVNAGWSLAGARTLLHTADSGHTWQSVTLPDPPDAGSQGLAQFDLATTGHTVVVSRGIEVKGGDRMFFDVSHDDGRSWTTRPFPAGFAGPRFAEHVFDATDASHWVLTSGRQLRTTSDGGVTWQIRPDFPLAADGDLIAPIRFPTPDVGWVTTRGGRVLRTTDGGRTWNDVTNGGAPAPAVTPISSTTTTMPAPPPQPVDIPIAVASSREAWLCSAPAEYTRDGGVNWRSIKSTASSAPIAQYPQEPLCSAVPGGIAWKLEPSYDPSRPQLVRIEPGSPPRAIALSVVPQYTTISDLVFVDERHGWMLTQKSELATTRELFTTSNGGASWNVDKDTMVDGGLHFTSATDGWASSASSAPAVLHTTDGGRTWRSVPVPALKPDPSIPGGIGIAAVTPDAIIALGSRPSGNLTALYFDVSTDGGRTWTMRSGPTNRSFGTTEPRAFSATDTDHWQLSGLDWLWTTQDGGRHWTEVAQFAGLASVSHVAFLTPAIGFVSGSGGDGATYSSTVVLQTTDGGDTWMTVDAQGAPLAANATVINTPGGFVGCPTRPLSSAWSGTPPVGLVDAARAYMGATPQTVGAVYPVGADPKGSFGSLFKFQVGSCGSETVTDSWVVELTGPIGQGGGGSTDQTQLVLAHSADGWHVFGRYH